MRLGFFIPLMAALCPAQSFAVCPQLEKPESVILVFNELKLGNGQTEPDMMCIQRGNPTVVETRLRPNGEPLRVEMEGHRMLSWSIDHGRFNISYETRNATGDLRVLHAGDSVAFDLVKHPDRGPVVSAHVEIKAFASRPVALSGCTFEMLRLETTYRESRKTARWDVLYAQTLGYPLASRVHDLDPKTGQPVRFVFESKAQSLAPPEEAERVCHPKPQS